MSILKNPLGAINFLTKDEGRLEKSFTRIA